MIENVEIPAAGLEPRGEITIEIFDEKTGELVAKEKKTNYVQQRMIQAIMDTTSRWPLTGATLYSYLPNEYFNSVVLTDNGAAPVPGKDDYIAGNVSGFASRTFPAGGTNRGAWNENESIVRTDYVKLVFDFATSQGNGTFQSIYTARKKNGTLPNNPPMSIATPVFATIPRFSFFARDATALYIVSADYSTIHKITNFKFGISMSSVAEVVTEPIAVPLEASGSSRYLQGIAVRGNEVYCYYLNYVDAKIIRKFTIGQTTPATNVKTFTYSPTGLIYDYTRDRFLVSEGTKVRIYDISFTEIEVVEFGFSVGKITGISEDGKFFIFNHQIIERATKRIELLADASDGSYAQSNILNMGKYTISSRSETMAMITPSPLFFSRALLDSPVTKTAQQNMKITYEFNIPPLNLFGA